MAAVNYEALIWEEIMRRFDIVCQLGLEDSYEDQAYIELPIKVTARDKGTQYLKALWESSIIRQTRLQKEKESESQRMVSGD